ncbi:cold-shock protein [Rhodococcus sp. IEGM 248]|uniref:cold shock domain-containing protein n=1 Tax=Rhodococcus opacus TaxID=37919 RepID=UPI0013C01671|nr:cold shock domain-containing protein [Rhodococcus opacus]MDV7088289.1 cold shock domain-containing protein [Rhodococcus opacus]NDV08845.1 cold-shock protein [Rhodococcus sp. IEGM 248]
MVKWFNGERILGFIAPANGVPDVLVDFSEITGSGFESLDENQRVEFEVARGSRARSPRIRGVSNQSAGPHPAGATL